ncbi:MAG: aminotransferase class I/II-fold pyridoxal phosphate-dependent enzyme [Filimonas sp.]|nr:aminotransferase class I/II-fold pyridoxal phosphate-dependent enzyme [Filimonas sp.]
MSNPSSEKIWLSSPHMGAKEFEFVKEAFDTNWIAPLGPHVNGFETDLKTYLGNNVHVAALSAGTAAIHLALILLDVKADDEVLCQSFTFSASANPITYLGAKPVFIDSEKDTWNMCPELLEQAIIERSAAGKKPKAIIPVHLYGMPAKIERIMEIADKYDIPVIEDAAEALGSSSHGQRLGTFGKMGILSFNGNKIITTSGGGALVAGDETIIQKATFLATQARDAAPHYQHSHIGYNYRMSNVSAGIGRGQMVVLDERIAQRRNNFLFYKEALKDIPGISFVEEPAGAFSNRWLTTVIIEPSETGGITREDIRIALEKNNIESRPLWKPMHLQPVFKNCLSYTNGVSETLFENGLCLPSGSNLTTQQLSTIVEIIKQLFR